MLDLEDVTTSEEVGDLAVVAAITVAAASLVVVLLSATDLKHARAHYAARIAAPPAKHGLLLAARIAAAQARTMFARAVNMCAAIALYTLAFVGIGQAVYAANGRGDVSVYEPLSVGAALFFFGLIVAAVVVTGAPTIFYLQALVKKLAAEIRRDAAAGAAPAALLELWALASTTPRTLLLISAWLGGHGLDQLTTSVWSSVVGNGSTAGTVGTLLTLGYALIMTAVACLLALGVAPPKTKQKITI